MMKKSLNNICFIDSTKFNNEGSANIFNLSEIQKIITDNNISEDIIEDFKKINKTKLIIY